MGEPKEPDDAELARLVTQLKQEEISAEDARLKSRESFEAWIKTHPALQYSGVVELMNQYGPALLEIIKRLIGA